MQVLAGLPSGSVGFCVLSPAPAFVGIVHFGHANALLGTGHRATGSTDACLIFLSFCFLLIVLPQMNVINN